MRLGVDFSQYGGQLDQETIACWKQQGVSHAVVQYSALMQQHLDALIQAGGIEIEGYVYLYWNKSQWNQTPLDRVKLALAAAGGTNHIKRLWLDAEDSEQPYQESQLVECVNYLQQVGMPCGIYTGAWWWIPNTGNSQTFKNLPLWDANYLAQGDPPKMQSQPQDMGAVNYGGWIKRTIWQWHNTTTLCGHSVDLNVLEDVAQPQPQPIPEEEEDDDMKSWHAWATWFENKILGPSDDVYLVQAKTDFSLPDNAKAVMIQPLIEQGGNVEFFHGNTIMPAANVGNNTFIVNLDDKGTINMQSRGGCTFSHLHCVGYFT